MPFRPTHLSGIAAVCVLTVAAGCAQQPPIAMTEQYPDSHKLDITRYEPVTEDIYTRQDDPVVEVMRAGRYKLVATSSREEQTDLLTQTIKVSIPTRLQPSVGDGLEYTLNRSGYKLCPAKGDAALETLFSRPLPAAHYELGPMPLHTALQLLGGPSYQLRIEPIAREVCFGLRVANIDSALLDHARIVSAADAAEVAQP